MWLGLTAALIAGAVWTTSVSAATLVSDKDDYLPGETAYLSGFGFQPGEAVAVSLAVHNADGIVIDYAVGGVYADGEGALTAAWLVPQEALNTWIEATAVGDQSAVVAVAYFTDEQPCAIYGKDFVLLNPAITIKDENVVTVKTQITGGADPVDSVTANVSGAAPGFDGKMTLENDGYWTLTFKGTCGGVTYNFTGVNASHGTCHRTLSVGGDDKSVTRSVTTAACPSTPPQQQECPPKNQAPTISASDYLVANVCATWNGSALTVTVPVQPANFSPVTSDPEKDPVIVTLDVSEVTLTGLGDVEATVTLTATDDPSARNVQGCPALVPQSATCTAKVTAKLLFNFIGFAAPLDNSTARKVKNGSTVPVKFQLTDCHGNYICSTPTPNTIWVGLQSQTAPTGGVGVNDSGAANDNGTDFRYCGTCDQYGTWIYNLSTKTGYSANTTYKVTAILADKTTHDVLISITK